jgi:membrane associated rhomboid family serine protease
MFPLRDINPRRTFPVITYVIIALNVAAFLYQLALAQGEPAIFQAIVQRYGLVPYTLTVAHDTQRLPTLITSMFMHGGFMHLGLNMWMLHIFGDNVEDALGKVRFIVFYLTAGIFAAIAHVLIDPSSTLPMVGASGAISGILGAYIRLFPKARVVAVLPIFIIFIVRELPAFWFIGVWFLLQLIEGFGSLDSSTSEGIAFFAHIGGFVAGVWLVGGVKPQRNSTAGWKRSDER